MAAPHPHVVELHGEVSGAYAWACENVSGLWSRKVVEWFHRPVIGPDGRWYVDRLAQRTEFSFADIADAAFFKLRWA